MVLQSPVRHSLSLGSELSESESHQYHLFPIPLSCNQKRSNTGKLSTLLRDLVFVDRGFAMDRDETEISSDEVEVKIL